MSSRSPLFFADFWLWRQKMQLACRLHDKIGRRLGRPTGPAEKER
ncbi:hypothetical protein HMPREF0239_02088 [Clostridium sp. ATCC BAA-442]|nr:hypothetical protein HMPREF0239_02088 [Clostridium sp. ATCC BAA-442]